MKTGASAVGSLVLRTFLWLPVCFVAWFLAAPVHSTIAAAIARVFVAFFNGLLVSATELSGQELLFVTTLQVQASAGQMGVLTVEVNPLLYTYGLAFFVALMLAARAPWRRLLVGCALLLPFQGWGIGFDFLAQVGAKLGPDVAARAGLLGAPAEIIALAYQLGVLLFPSGVPVVLWVAFNRDVLQGLAPTGREGPKLQA